MMTSASDIHPFIDTLLTLYVMCACSVIWHACVCVDVGRNEKLGWVLLAANYFAPMRQQQNWAIEGL